MSIVRSEGAALATAERATVPALPAHPRGKSSAAMIREALTQRVPRWTLVYPRILLGWMWLNAGLDKVHADGWSMMEVVGDARSYGWYRVFIDGVAIPHQALFNFLVTWGETAAGVSLILGAASRLGAGTAVFLSLNYALVQGRNPLRFSGWDSVYMWLAVIMLLGSAGRCLGVDQYLAKRWPDVPLW